MRIAIAGYGLEGRASYDYWSSDAANDITIVDESLQPKFDLPAGVKTLLGPGAFEKLDGFDMVVRTAGLSPFKIKTDGKIWSATNEFFTKCPARIIGVTGSKGKGTTSSLITEILKASGRKVWLVGNIGTSALEVLDKIQPDDIVVYELSSFQLWDIKKSPHTAVVLMIEPDHLDVHVDMEDYVTAKSNISRFQSADDIAIFYAENQYSRRIGQASAGRKIAYPTQLTAHVADGKFYYAEQELCSIDSLKIVGKHNVDNAIAAIDAAWEYTHEATIIEAGLSNFNGLPHRLSFVRHVRGVDYYDDSIATTPSSAIAALRAFNKPKVIILGGSSKGSDFSQLAEEITHHDAQAILIGDEATRIAQALENAGFNSFEIMKDASAKKFVERASELAKAGSVVLLSPAAASFGLFKNYVDRADQFIAAVNDL